MNIKEKNDLFPEMSVEELKIELKAVDEELYEMEGGPEPDYDALLTPEEKEDQEREEHFAYLEKLHETLSKKSSDIELTLRHRELKESFRNNYDKAVDSEHHFKGKIIPNCVGDVDLLNVDKSAEQFATYIQNNNKRNNIAIIGGWGTGKSTFMNLIKNHIKDDESISIIDYDAAAYEKQEQIWGNIYNCILKAYNENTKFSLLRYRCCKFCIKHSSDLGERILYIVGKILVLIACLGLLYHEVGSFNFLHSISRSNAKSVLEWLVTYAAGCGVVLDILSLLLPIIGGLLKPLILLFKRDDSKKETFDCAELLGTREQISAELDVIFSAWFNWKWRKSKQSKLVIIVDELDRCSDEGIRNFFQAVHLLLDKERISFIFAIDEEILQKALNIDDVRNQILKYAQNIYSTQYRYSYNNLIEYICSDTNISEKEVSIIKSCMAQFDVSFTPRKIISLLSNLSFIKDHFVSIYYKDVDNTLLFTEFIVFYIMYVSETKLTISTLTKMWERANDIRADHFESLFNVLGRIDGIDRDYLSRNRKSLTKITFGNASDYLMLATKYEV